MKGLTPIRVKCETLSTAFPAVIVDGTVTVKDSSKVVPDSLGRYRPLYNTCPSSSEGPGQDEAVHAIMPMTTATSVDPDKES